MGAEPLFWFGILHVVSIIALGVVLGSTLFLAITHTRTPLSVVNGERITPDGTDKALLSTRLVCCVLFTGPCLH